MQFSTLFVAAISALTAAAAPASSVAAFEEKRGCQIAYPETDGYTWVSRYYNPDFENNEHAVFKLPPGAVGPCNLKLHFESEHTPALWENTQVHFRYGTGIGTTYTFVPGPVDRYLGSFGCAETMDFLLTISEEQGKPGYVGFPQSTTNGLYMSYGC